MIKRTFRPDGLPSVELKPKEIGTDLWRAHPGRRKSSTAEGPRLSVLNAFRVAEGLRPVRYTDEGYKFLGQEAHEYLRLRREAGLPEYEPSKEKPAAIISWRNDEETLKVVKVRQDARLPVCEIESDGYDLFSAIDVRVPNDKIVKVPTGLVMEFRRGIVGLIKEKSIY